MFKNTIKREIAKFVAEGGITTEDVKLVKRDNLDNQREYNADNNNEIKGLKVSAVLLSEKLEALEKYLGIEFNLGNMGGETCCDCGEYVEEPIESTYTKAKKVKGGKK